MGHEHQRRILECQPTKAVSARHQRSGVSLRVGQHKDAGGEPLFSASLDQAHYRRTQADCGVWPGWYEVPAQLQFEGLVLCPHLRIPAGNRGGQPVTILPVCRARLVRFQTLRCYGGIQPEQIQERRGGRLRHHDRFLRILLVRSRHFRTEQPAGSRHGAA